LDGDLADGFGHVDHSRGHNHHHHEGDSGNPQVIEVRAHQLEELYESGWITGNNSGEDDQGYAVADSMLGDLLTQPHHDHGACDQGHHSGEVEQETAVGDHTALQAGKPDGDGGGVESAKTYRGIAGDLVHLLLSVRAFFFELFKIGNDRAQKLDHDRRGDIGHDAQGKHGGPFEVTSHKEVQQSKEGVATFSGTGEEGLQRCGIDSRDGDEAAQTIEHQKQGREEDLLLQVRNPEHVHYRFEHVTLPPPYRHWPR